MLGSIQTHFWAVRDYLAPVLRDSKFKESGRITPEEFVAAGDFLVYKFPTWQWEAGEAAKARDFLPKEKQYLVSRNVPCLRRVSQLAFAGGADEDSEVLMSFLDEGDASSSAGEDEDKQWVATHTSKDPNKLRTPAEIGEIPDIDSEPSTKLSETLASTHLTSGHSTEGHRLEEESAEEMPDMDDIPDMEDDDVEGMGSGGVIEEEDTAALKPETVPPKSSSGNLIQVRTYDCSITYDKYYQTPRMWLLGYDEHKTVLPPSSAFDDVSADHAQKTVTIEPFPHSSLSMASVHPCKHSSVMKKVIERMDRNVVLLQRKEREKEKKEGKGKWGLKKLTGNGGGGVKNKEPTSGALKDEDGPEGLRVDQYLVVFLKFMSSIVPTIEVDATQGI